GQKGVNWHERRIKRSTAGTQEKMQALRKRGLILLDSALNSATIPKTSWTAMTIFPKKN
ncbi:hypothetical protein BIFLAC_05647, partial [Bifidobacterium animalis subsp. lactis HN019]